MQHIPEEVQHPTERLQQNYQTQHSQEVAEKENMLAAQEEKRTTPGESSAWPDHDQSVSGGNNPPARQPTLPRSTMPDRPFAPSSSRPVPPPVPRQPGQGEGVATGQMSPARQPMLPRPAMPRQPLTPPSSRPVPPPVPRQPGQGEGVATGQMPPARQPMLPRPAMPRQPIARTPSAPALPSVPIQLGHEEGNATGQEPPARQPMLARQPMPRQPIDKNNAVGQNQKKPEINRTTNSLISRQDKPTPISSERHSDNSLSYSSDGSPLLTNDNKQSTQSKIIMVVDDSQTVRNIMALILNRSGYRSIRISSAMEALHTLTELIPDLIFLDITLPGMDGLDVCKIIKENPRTKQVPVVMLSGNNEVFDKVMGRLAGASDYITKPFEPESILMCIQTFLGKKSSHREGLWQGVR